MGVGCLPVAVAVFAAVGPPTGVSEMAYDLNANAAEDATARPLPWTTLGNVWDRVPESLSHDQALVSNSTRKAWSLATAGSAFFCSLFKESWVAGSGSPSPEKRPRKPSSRAPASHSRRPGS